MKVNRILHSRVPLDPSALYCFIERTLVSIHPCMMVSGMNVGLMSSPYCQMRHHNVACGENLSQRCVAFLTDALFQCILFKSSVWMLSITAMSSSTPGCNVPSSRICPSKLCILPPAKQSELNRCCGLFLPSQVAGRSHASCCKPSIVSFWIRDYSFALQ